MITERDREIIDFIYDIGFATIKHIADLFFTNATYKQDLARKRLRKILKTNEYIKVIKNQTTNESVYLPIDSKIKNVSMHNLKILDYACELKRLGVNIERIQIEPNYCDIRPDASVIFTFNGCRYYQLLEVQCRHAMVDIDRYSSQNVIQAILNDNENIAPNIIIIQNTNKNYSENNVTPFDIVQLDLSLNELAKVLI